MGITLDFARFILEVSNQLVVPLPDSEGTDKAMALGWPDMLFGIQEAASLFAEEPGTWLEHESDEEQSDKIKKYHAFSFEGRTVSAEPFFLRLGYHLDCIDLAKLRGKEIVADLSAKNSVSSLAESYGLVIDNGTAEHIFDVATAMANIASLVRPGGCAIHGNPLLMPNHGFWGFSPTTYFDFYESNGFNIECMYISFNKSRKIVRLDRHQYTQRFRLEANDECCLWVAARRSAHARRDLVNPVQSKYRAMLS